jgi:hypothetical protein
MAIVAGFWAEDNASSWNCAPCPLGGNCPGKLQLPFARRGYWAFPLARRPNGSLEHAVGFIACTYFSAERACQGGNRSDTDGLSSATASCGLGFEGAPFPTASIAQHLPPPCGDLTGAHVSLCDPQQVTPVRSARASACPRGSPLPRAHRNASLPALPPLNSKLATPEPVIETLACARSPGSAGGYPAMATQREGRTLANRHSAGLLQVCRHVLRVRQPIGRRRIDEFLRAGRDDNRVGRRQPPPLRVRVRAAIHIYI